jgi:DNA (cytosine-5)-methyltransferase 1
MKNGGLRFIDLFAGIGGFRLAFESQGNECVFSSEWDKFARKTYEANFGETPAGDIRQIQAADIPEFDVLCGDFPARPSASRGFQEERARPRHGFLDETQGTLFFEVARILKERRPQAFVLETLKTWSITTADGLSKSFAARCPTSSAIIWDYRILNAADVLPQNRERIFLVGFQTRRRPRLSISAAEVRAQERAAHGRHPGKENRSALSSVGSPVELSPGVQRKARKAGHGFGFGMIEPSGIARTLSARYYKDGSEILVPVKGGNPRRLTPRECARSWAIPKIFRSSVSDTQAYKQFGNSVAVPVVNAVAGQMLAAFAASGVGPTALRKQASVRPRAESKTKAEAMAPKRAPQRPAASAKGARSARKSSGRRRVA